MEAFGLNFCHGLGLGLHERPLVSRLNSLQRADRAQGGMVFAVETYCPASDGVSAARIEEEVVLTPNGAEDDFAVSGAGTADRQSVLMAMEPACNTANPIGWIGTGRMGYEMAERLAKARLRRHGLEPHAREGRAAGEVRREGRRHARRARRAATSCSAWCRRTTT